jgi:hypothetical protein
MRPVRMVQREPISSVSVAVHSGDIFPAIARGNGFVVHAAWAATVPARGKQRGWRERAVRRREAMPTGQYPEPRPGHVGRMWKRRGGRDWRRIGRGGRGRCRTDLTDPDGDFR